MLYVKEIDCDFKREITDFLEPGKLSRSFSALILILKANLIFSLVNFGRNLYSLKDYAMNFRFLPSYLQTRLLIMAGAHANAGPRTPLTCTIVIILSKIGCVCYKIHFEAYFSKILTHTTSVFQK